MSGKVEIKLELKKTKFLSTKSGSRSMDFFQVGGPARDETDETHRRSNAVIHG